MAYRDNMPFTIQQVADLLRLTVKRHTHKGYQVNCPFCLGKRNEPDTSGHMEISFQRDRFRCHRCGRNGGKLDLYAEFQGIDRKDAYKELCDILVGDRRLPARSAPPPAPVQIPTVETDIVLPIVEIDKTYRHLLELLILTSEHRENLRNRGLTDAEIDRLGYRSVPATGHRKLAKLLLQKDCKLEGVPGFFEDENGDWKLNVYKTGIIMPSRSIDGLIQGLQVRKDIAKKRKCYWLTGTDKKLGKPLTTQAHFTNVKTDAATDTVYLTEGIMKADIAAFFSDSFFIALPGVSHYEALERGLQELKELVNIHYVAIAWDMDQYENPAVMNSIAVIAQKIKEAGFGVRKINWDPKTKGIDDFLKSVHDAKHNNGGFKNDE